MSALKAELKMLVTHEVGVRVDDSLEVAKKDLAMLEGRQVSLGDAAKTIETLLEHVDKDLEEEKLPEEAAQHVKRYIVRGVNALQNLAQQATNNRIAQTGRVQALEQTVTMLKNMVDAERSKAEAIKLAESTESAGTTPVPVNGHARETGVRPAMSIKEQRLAEEGASEKPEAPKRRGGRKPRADNA